MEIRVSQLEEDKRDMKTMLANVEARTARLEITTAKIEAMLAANLPQLATKADLAEKPSKTYLWGILGVLLTAYACGLASLAILR
jgi:hypothetical protein